MPVPACDRVKELEKPSPDACKAAPQQCVEADGAWGVVAESDVCETGLSGTDDTGWHVVHVPADGGAPRVSGSFASRGMPTLSNITGRVVLEAKHCPSPDAAPCTTVGCIASSSSATLLDCLDAHEEPPPAWIAGAVAALDESANSVGRLLDGRWARGPHFVSSDAGQAWVELEAMPLETSVRFGVYPPYLAGMPIRAAIHGAKLDFDDPAALAWDKGACAKFAPDDRAYTAPPGTPRNLLQCWRPKIPDAMYDLWAAALCWRLAGTPLPLIADRWRRRCLVIDIPDCDELSSPQLEAICQVDGSTDDTRWSREKIGMPEYFRRALQHVSPWPVGRTP